MRGHRWVWMLVVALLGGAVGRLHAVDYNVPRKLDRPLR